MLAHDENIVLYVHLDEQRNRPAVLRVKQGYGTKFDQSQFRGCMSAKRGPHRQRLENACVVDFVQTLEATREQTLKIRADLDLREREGWGSGMERQSSESNK